jgi:hypothetical protein
MLNGVASYKSFGTSSLAPARATTGSTIRPQRVSTVAVLLAGSAGFPARSESFRYRVQTGSAAHPVSYPIRMEWVDRVGRGCPQTVEQPFSIFLPWRNPWNNFQVSGNHWIKIIISTSHGTLAWSVSCRYNNTIIIVNALLSREWYFSVDLFISANLLARS